MDAKGLIIYGDASGWISIFGHFGAIAKIIILASVIFFLLIHSHIIHYSQLTVKQFSVKRFYLLSLIQLLLYVFFFWLSRKIFLSPENASTINKLYYILWFFVGIIIFCIWLASIWQIKTLTALLQSLRLQIFYALLFATLVWWLAQKTGSLWGPLNEATFYLSSELLQLISAQPVFVDASRKIIGTGDFFVNIAPSCSGYEGIGLITAFLSIYLYTHKSRFLFPRAFILLPIGAACIWLLNIVRIVALILIGQVSPETAVGGFHSQAGWVTFIATSLGLAWGAGYIPFFTARPATKAIHCDKNNSSLATATLIPFVVLMGSTLFTTLLKGDFDWLYPIRVIATGIALILTWKTLSLRLPRLKLSSIAAGVIVSALWFLLANKSPHENQVFLTSIGNPPIWLISIWWVFRFFGSAAIAPLAEELAFRGYIYCRLASIPITLKAPLPLSIPALTMSAALFGILHGDWIAGIFAGLVYGWLRIKTNCIEQVIYAHSITNSLLFLISFSTGYWSLI